MARPVNMPRCGGVALVHVGLMLLAATLAACAPDLPHMVAMDPVRVVAADDARWSEPDADDSAAPLVRITDVTPPSPVWWLRGTLEVDAAAVGHGAPMAVAVAALASCDVYWDGALLGRNGVVAATPGGEQPGTLFWYAVVPPPVTVGRHAVSLRCSAHHRGFVPSMGFYGVWLTEATALGASITGATATTLVCAGALITVGLLQVLTWLLALWRRRRPRGTHTGGPAAVHLWLGSLGLSAGVMVVAEAMRSLVQYTYDLHIVRLRMLAGLAWLVGVSLAGFVTASYPRRGRWAALVTVMVGAGAGLGVPGFDAKVVTALAVGLVVSLVWTLRVALDRRWDAVGASAAIAGCVAVAAMAPGQFIDFYLFFMLSGLCVAMLIVHAVAQSRLRVAFEAAALRTARLEIELLRRQLAPHFLLNTLAALGEWFESEPEVASAMVEHLGEELRLLSEVSAQSSVAMATELALCRSHLAVMAHRRDEPLVLDATDIDTGARIPPALFHTLIENALSHNTYRAAGAVFRLRQRPGPTPRVTRYIFDAPLCAPGRRGRNSEQLRGGGTGMRYIHARLRESYGDRYQVTDGACDVHGEACDLGAAGAVWRTVIDIPHDVESPA